MDAVMEYAEKCWREHGFKQWLGPEFEEAYKQGFKEGYKQGLEQGLKQGRKEGCEEGIKGTVLVLKNLNTPVQVIREQLMKAYGLSDNEVQKYLK